VTRARVDALGAAARDLVGHRADAAPYTSLIDWDRFTDAVVATLALPPTPLMRLASSVSKPSDADREHVHQLSAERSERMGR
jgi:hypothetical protein